ncbi:hypothetical protein HDE_07299 [Halotydeus destructor]|nr:hypothetical protein HDE_07299 [Halotydeus destructor]
MVEIGPSFIEDDYVDDNDSHTEDQVERRHFGDAFPTVDSFKIAELQTEIRSLKQEIDNLNQNLTESEELNAKLHSSNEDLDRQLRDERDKLQLKLDLCEKERDDLETRLSEYATNVHELEQEISTLNQKYDFVQVEIQIERRKSSVLQNQIEEYNQEVSYFTLPTGDSGVDDEDDDENSLSKANTEVSSPMQNLSTGSWAEEKWESTKQKEFEKKIEELNMEKEQIDHDRQLLEAQVKNLLKELKDLKDELQQSKSSTQALRAKLEESRKKKESSVSVTNKYTQTLKDVTQKEKIIKKPIMCDASANTDQPLLSQKTKVNTDTDRRHQWVAFGISVFILIPVILLISFLRSIPPFHSIEEVFHRILRHYLLRRPTASGVM